MNILHTPVSYYQNITDTSSQTTVILYDYLTNPIPSAEQQLRIVRSVNDNTTLKQAKAKLPYITPSGTFSHRDDASLITFSGLIQIDMDRKDNLHHPNWESIPPILKDDPHIAYVGRSSSGGSYWGLIPIAHPDRLVEHWEALHHRFSTLYNINLDPCTKTLSQPRYYAYDTQSHLNPQAVTFAQVMESKPVPPPPPHPARKVSTVTDRSKFDTYVSAICEARVDITGDRKQWICVGESIKAELGDDGMDAFIDICQFSPLFDEGECRKAYRSLKPTQMTLGTFFYLCHKHNIQPEEYRPRTRVHRPLRKPITEARQTVTPPAPTWVNTIPLIARWTQDIKPEEVEVDDELPTEDPTPHWSASKAFVAPNGYLYIETPPLCTTLTVYTSISAYNNRTEIPKLVDRNTIDCSAMTALRINIKTLQL